MIAVTVQPGDTLSGIAAANGESLSAVEAANPQIGNPNLIFSGQNVSLSGSSWTPPSSPAETPQTPSAPSYTASPSYVPPASAPAPAATSSSGGLSSVPGVPQSFAACVAQRESSNGTNQAYNGGVFGIITASGINVNGQSIEAQKAAFSKLYAQYGTAPWTPSDGCTA